MAEMKILKCPNCNAALEIENGLDTFYCKYCGYKILLNGQSKAAYRAKTRIKEMEHDERMADKQLEHEKYKIAQKIKREGMNNKLVITLMLCIVLFLIITFACDKRESRKEEVQLQQLVEEVQTEIANKDFDAARIKVQSIQYTAGWSSDIEEKWDNIREELVKQLEDAEQAEQKAQKAAEKAQKQAEKEAKKSSEQGFWSRIFG